MTLTAVTPRPPRFSIVIPAQDADETIGACLERYADAFADSEIIVVLDGQADPASDTVERISAAKGNVVGVRIPDGVAKGGAVRTGFLVAHADIVGYVDAVGSTPPAEMRRLCESMGDYDGIIGSRWLRASRVSGSRPLRLKVASRGYNALVCLLFGLRYSDTKCDAKVFRRTALERVLRVIETSNIAFDADMLYAMKRLNMRVREEPISWTEAPNSRLRLVPASLSTFAAVVRLRLHHSFLSGIVPFYDRCFPTNPLLLRDKLRILVINWRDPKHPRAGGAEVYLFEQAKHWIRWGHHVEWLSGGFPGGSPRDCVDSIPVRRVGNFMTVYASVPLAYLREFRDRFDIIVDSFNGLPFFSPLFSMKPKICILYHVHRELFKKHLGGWLGNALAWCEETFVPMVYRKVHFVTISQDTLHAMREVGIGDSSAGLVRCGVDAGLAPGKKADVPTVLYLGRLKAYKRVDGLIEVFADVRTAMPSAVLRIAGTGDALPALRALADGRGLGDSVIFEGFVDDERKRELLQSAWVMASLSEIEGWGISVIEANACGTPAVVHDVPGLREAIVHGQSGLIVPEGHDVGATILRVLQDAPLRAALERGALARAKTFSWETAAREMLYEMMRAISGLEARGVDLDRRWTFFEAVGSRNASSLLDTYSLRT